MSFLTQKRPRKARASTILPLRRVPAGAAKQKEPWTGAQPKAGLVLGCSTGQQQPLLLLLRNRAGTAWDSKEKRAKQGRLNFCWVSECVCPRMELRNCPQGSWSTTPVDTGICPNQDLQRRGKNTALILILPRKTERNFFQEHVATGQGGMISNWPRGGLK